MEEIIHKTRQINTNAEKTYLTWNGNRILKSDFGQIYQSVCLYDDDVYLGIVEYPNSSLGDSNKYLVAERDNNLVKIPLKHRPYRFSYTDRRKGSEYAKLIPKIWNSTTEHQDQFHAWNKLFSRFTFQHLYLATAQSIKG
jgi:hypothetical protein